MDEEELDKEQLPHLYGFPFYKWQYKFFHDYSRNAFLTAANQIGKSSVAIRKMINLATNKSLWPKIWNSVPRQFWYIYPTLDVANREFVTKWEPEFMPRVDPKHPVYGWRTYKSFGRVTRIEFNNGISRHNYI